ncbi:Uncharacterised protein [Metamycoplasma cloacale]|uniref:Uncharacterized protein n=1 Tax=Metamycoplasma cloacale TaxID=92401 RepID=A0A2Z4LMD3_9BACT|nr:hypothetical protein [Metamycoplasma cloacale]AWX42919.1 hypothetical protein DK849_02520 [Metamycoplasma cloacale]VEU79256.1 Uncharacterised protein [Metamycoplasma cloacale]
MKTIKKIAITNLVLVLVLIILLSIGIAFMFTGVYVSLIGALVNTPQSNSALDTANWIKISCLVLIIPIFILLIVLSTKIKNTTYKMLTILSVLFIPLNIVVCSMIIHTKKDLTQLNNNNQIQQKQINKNDNLVDRLPE